MRGAVGSASPVGRKGIVAHSTVRFAAGTGVVAASLLIVGPNPAVAVADRHWWGHSNNDHRKNGSSVHGGHPKRAASNFVTNVIGIGAIAGVDTNAKPDLDPPKMELGTSSVGEDLFAAESIAPEGQMALRSAAIAEAPVVDNVTAAAVPRSGSDHAGQSAAAFRAPRVIFGNGRTPGTNIAHRGPAPEAVLAYDALMAPQAVPAAPAVPTAIEINIPPLPPPLPPVERIRPAELVVGQFGTGTTDTVTDPLAGVAGLFLMPAIGAVLGFRQARAAQSLRESVRC
jgi:hypothetical protein